MLRKQKRNKLPATTTTRTTTYKIKTFLFTKGAGLLLRKFALDLYEKENSDETIKMKKPGNKKIRCRFSM